tara:strand:- start:2565 stop:3974 length:1410 start_codon:yes stop_codon:yes gene_type:complete
MATALNFGQGLKPPMIPQGQSLYANALMNQMKPAANIQPMNMPQAQPVASGSGPAFRFQDLNKAYQLDPRNTLASALMKQGMRGGPVRTPLEGIGRLSQSLVGAMLQKKALDRLEGQETARQENLQSQQDAITATLPPNFQSMFTGPATQQSLQQAQQINLQKLLAPTQEMQPVTDVPGMTGAKVVSTGPFGDKTISSVNLAAIPKAQETFTQLTNDQAKALNLPIDKGQVYQQSDTTSKVTQIGGSGSTTNISLGSDKEGYKETLSLLKESGEKGRAASSSMSNINQMLTLLEDENIQTGTGQGFLNTLNKVGQIFNPEFQLKEVAGIEAFQGFANQVILPKVKQLGSRPTDKDLEFVVDSFASLKNSVAGNKFLLKALQLQNARDVKYNQDLIEFIKGERAKGTSDSDIIFNALDFTDKWFRTDPLMTEASNALKAEFKSITGQDADAVSSSQSKLDKLIQNGLVKR